LVLIPVAGLGWIYTVTAIVLGVMFIAGVLALGRNPTPAASMRLFGFSITYVTVLFGSIMLDVFVQYGW
jgi:protoheme IX farnesyltransferase